MNLVTLRERRIINRKRWPDTGPNACTHIFHMSHSFSLLRASQYQTFLDTLNITFEDGFSPEVGWAQLLAILMTCAATRHAYPSIPDSVSLRLITYQVKSRVTITNLSSTTGIGKWSMVAWLVSIGSQGMMRRGRSHQVLSQSYYHSRLLLDDGGGC